MDRFQSVKLCECGCGEPTLLANKANSIRGDVKGTPRRYLKGHQWKPSTKMAISSGKLRELYDKPLSVEQLAQHFDVAATTVKRWLRRANIPIRDREYSLKLRFRMDKNLRDQAAKRIRQFAGLGFKLHNKQHVPTRAECRRASRIGNKRIKERACVELICSNPHCNIRFTRNRGEITKKRKIGQTAFFHSRECLYDDLKRRARLAKVSTPLVPALIIPEWALEIMAKRAEREREL